MKSHILWMAFRQIMSRKKRSLTFMTLMSVIGVSIGVMALVVVLSVMGGFEHELKFKMLRGLPHLEILAENAIAGFSLDTLSIKKVQKTYPNALGIEAFIRADVVLKKERHLAPVTMLGVEPHGGKLWGFSSGMVHGSIQDLQSQADDEHPRIIIGEALAVQLNVGVGDTVTLLTPQAGVAEVLAGGKLSHTFTIVGTFITDLARYDNRYVVTALDDGRKFLPDYDPSLDEERFVTGIALTFIKPEKVEMYADRVSQFPGLKVNSWKNVNKSLLFALQLEKFTMGSILLLIVLVAAFSISGTMMMTVFHKQSQIALMRALGMEKNDVVKLYLAHGFTIGFLGALIGLIVGLLICAALYYFQFMDLPPGVYYQQKLPVKFLPIEYAIICTCALVLSLIAAAYPARIAANQHPSLGLRYM